jgi:hypothetical protein
VSPSPLLCTREDKPKLEARNGVDQIGYIDYLVRKLHAVELRVRQLATVVDSLGKPRRLP